jgi:hypothetical protein
MRRLIWAAAAFGLAACAALPPAQPTSLDSGLLVARVAAHGALFRKSIHWADSAQIAALDEKGVPLPGGVYASGLAAGGCVVFFNLPAGRYVLRAASFPARGVRYRLLAPQEAEAKRAVVLRPGTVAFLGEHGFDSRWPDFDVGLGRTALIVSHWLTPFLRRPVLPRDADMRGFESGPVEETRALHAVRGALAGTQWSRVVDARLRELSAAEPPKVAGSLRPRELPLREEPFLSWRDTLHWGEPRRAPMGLAWKRPGGEAQIAVFFTTASAPGFAGWAAAVSELRSSAAASVEDAGGVYEVRVATRAGVGARATKYRYPDGVLVGSETKVIVTETTLVPDGWGLYTARLLAPRGEFDAALPAYREFLLQLVLGPPKPKALPKSEAVMPFVGGPP